MELRFSGNMKLNSKLLEKIILVIFTFIGFSISNIFFLFWIRNPSQTKNFPRQFLSYLQEPSRWKYADVGTKNISSNIVLLGDSYIEGDGDDFTSNKYNYSLGHYLHNRFGLEVFNFGTGGSDLIHQMHKYNAAMSGKYFPLFDYVPPESRSRRIILFFFEGNDIDNVLSPTRPSISSFHKPLPRYFPLAHYIYARFLSKLFIGKFPYIEFFSDNYKKENSQPVTNIICSKNNIYCKTFSTTLYSAAPEIAEEKIILALSQTSKAIKEFKNENKLCLVYLPSPATVYSPEKIYFRPYGSGNLNSKGWISAQRNQRKSDLMRNYLSNEMAKIGIPFVDPTNALVLAAKDQFLHGSVDPNHFVSKGFNIVAEEIIRHSEKCLYSSYSKIND